MLRYIFFSLWSLAAFGICAQPIQVAEIGSKVENFQLSDVSGTNRSLQSYSGKVVVLVFWSFKCPVSLAYNDRIEALQSNYAKKGVIVLGVASDPNETPAEIRANLSNLNITVPILLDTGGELAERLGATHTPSVFIIDGKSTLRYRGSIDNNKKIGDRGRTAFAEDAIDAIMEGRIISVSETKAFGCSIRRKIL
jgi:peroxiredoxin